MAILGDGSFAEGIETYWINEMVYLVNGRGYAFVYTPTGEFRGAGAAFHDYVKYMEGEAA